MKTTLVKKFLSLFLAAVLFLGILPVIPITAATVIDTVDITGVPVPQLGQLATVYTDSLWDAQEKGKVKFNGMPYNYSEEAYGYVESIGGCLVDENKIWVDYTATPLSAGIYYYFESFVLPEGYRFDENVTVTVEGAGDVEVRVRNEGTKMSFYAKYQVGDIIVDTITITGVPIPAEKDKNAYFLKDLDDAKSKGKLLVNGNAYDSSTLSYGNLITAGDG